MKKTILLPVLWGFVIVLYAQEPTLKVAASAGNSYDANTFVLDWTLGEVIVSTINNDGVLVTQGMHQPIYTATAIHELPVELGTVHLYPNPVTDFAKIEVALTTSSDMEIQLADVSGKCIWIKKYSGKTITDTLELSELASGTYFVTIQLKDKTAYQTFQIAKIN